MKFSPSQLNAFLECPRCYWLDKMRGIKPPRGIFPSLPGGFDLRLKDYYDHFRAKKVLPPELQGRVEGSLYSDQEQLRKWRSWRSSDLVYVDQSGATLGNGAIDDLAVDYQGQYIPLDYKTRGFPYKQGTGPEQYYQNQMNCYEALLSAYGLQTAGYAIITLHYPTDVVVAPETSLGTCIWMECNVVVYKIKTCIADAIQVLRNAHKCLQGDLPPSSETCERCHYVEARTTSIV